MSDRFAALVGPTFLVRADSQDAVLLALQRQAKDGLPSFPLGHDIIIWDTVTWQAKAVLRGRAGVALDDLDTLILIRRLVHDLNRRNAGRHMIRVSLDPWLSPYHVRSILNNGTSDETVDCRSLEAVLAEVRRVRACVGVPADPPEPTVFGTDC